LKIGLLNQKVIVQKNGITEDEIGNRTNAWEDYYSCHATISGEGAGKTENAGTVTDHSDMSVTLRWCKKVSEMTTTGYRIIFKGEAYNITSIDHMSYRGRALKIRCKKERMSDG